MALRKILFFTKFLQLKPFFVGGVHQSCDAVDMAGHHSDGFHFDWKESLASVSRQHFGLESTSCLMGKPGE